MHKLLLFFLKPKTNFARWFIALILVAIFALASLGYFDAIRTLLSSKRLTFSIGDFSFSVYDSIKGLIALIILFWGASVLSATGEKHIKNLRSFKTSNRSLLLKGFQSFIYFVAFLIGFNVLGIDLTTLAVVGGAVGIGVGFGLQKITSNFISGLILLFEKSVEQDDLVELDDGMAGFVRYTGARYTLVETFEGREIMIPNEDFITSRVTNWTFSNTKGRIDINVGVSYDSDLDKVYELILEAAGEHPRCSQDNEPECYLVEFGDSSVNFTLFFWVDDIISGRKKPRSDVLFSIWRKFKENNIEIPFPQRDVHIKEAVK